MKTYTTIKDYVNDDIDLYIFDDEIEDEYEDQFKIGYEVFTYISTPFDICDKEFKKICDTITSHNGTVHYTSEHHTGSFGDKTGYIVYQHPSKSFRDEIINNLPKTDCHGRIIN